MDSLLDCEQSQFEKFTDASENLGKNMNLVDLVTNLLQSFMKILGLLNSRSANHQMDQVIKQSGSKLQVEKGQKGLEERKR